MVSSKRIFYSLLIFFLLLVSPFLFELQLNWLREIQFDWIKIKFLLWGVSFSFLLNRFSKIPKLIYIFFHEMAHAGAAIFFSAKIVEFHISSESGYIKSNKNNIFIRLAPYLFPPICFIILTLHYGSLIYFRYYDGYLGTFYFSFFLAGFFFTTTCYYNIKLIIQETSDIDREELMLSFLVIVNSFFLSSSFIFYCLFESERLIEKIYFLSP